MTKINKLNKVINHSSKFLKILIESCPQKAIKMITHTSPLLIFWISPKGEYIEVKTSHFEEPPLRDKSILSSKTYKGCLRGRVAYIGNKIYVVIATSPKGLSKNQLALLRISFPRILHKLKTKGTKQADLNNVNFVTEYGEDIRL